MNRIFAVHSDLLRSKYVLIFVLLFDLHYADANTRTWNGAGVLNGTGGTDLCAAANWSGGTALLSSDDYQINVGAVNGSYTLIMSSSLAINSLSVTFSASGNVFRQVIINISQNLLVSGAIAITNATANGSVNHEIDFNVTGGNTTCNSFTTNANGIGSGSITRITNAGKVDSTGGFPQIGINISAAAVLTCSGNWSSTAGSSANTTTTISNSGTLTINGTTTLSSPQATSNSQFRQILLLTGNSPANTIFNDAVSLGAAASATITSINGSYTLGLNATAYGGISSASTGTITLKKDITLGPSATTTNYNNFTLLFDGASTQTATDNTGTLFNVTGNLQIGNSYNPVVNIVFNNGVAGNGMFQVYNNLSVNGTSVLSIGLNETLNNISNSGTLYLATNAILKLAGTSSGNTNLYGTDIGSNFPKKFSTYSLSSGTVEYNAFGTQTLFSTPTYGNIIIGDAALMPSTTAILSGALTVSGNVLINTNATLDASSNNYTIYAKGNWTNNGSFTARSGAVSFNNSASGNNTLFSGNTSFYDLILTNNNGTTDFGNTTETITHSFSTSGGTMNGNTSTFIFTGNSFIIGANAKNFYNLQINSGANVTHSTGGGNIHVANSFVNNGSLTENTGYSFYFDQSGAVETISGSGTFNFGKLVVGDGSGFSFATTLNCSSDIIINGGSMGFNKSSIYNGINNTVVFSTNSCVIGGTGTANFYNAVTNVSINFGSGLSKITSNLTINPSGSVITNSPFYNTAATLIYNTTNLSLTTNAEWTGNTAYTGVGAPYNVIVQNTNNILLAGSRTVPGTLTIGSINSVNINGYTLTVNTGFSGTGTLKGSTSSGLITSGNGNIYFDASLNFLHTLTINAAATITLGNALNIAAGTSFGVLTVNGVLKTNDNLTLKSDINGTAQVAQSYGSISGNVTVERYIPALRAWRFLALPFSSSTQTINDAWQEGKVNPDLNCNHNQYVQAGYGTEITYNGTNGFDPNITSNPSIKIWAGNSWTSPTSTYTPITNYSAYCLFIRGDRTVCLSGGTSSAANVTTLRPKGILNETGSSNNSVTKFYSGMAGDYMFIGNPYASSIDLSNILSSNRAGTNGIDYGKFWVWDPKLSPNYGVGGYVAYSNGVQVPNYTSATYTAGTIIQSGQAFMVHTNSNNASVNFQQTDKVSSETNVFGKLPKFDDPIIYTNLMVALDTLTLVDGVASVFSKTAYNDTDSRNTGKLWNFKENIALLRNESALAIEFRPMLKLTDTVFYQLLAGEQTYALQIFSNRFSGMPVRAWLADKYLNRRTEINLNDTTLYNFTVSADSNSYSNRFMLVFNRQFAASPIPVTKKDNQQNPGATGISCATTSGNVSLFPNPVTTGNEVVLKFTGVEEGDYKINLYNINGENLKTQKIKLNKNNNIYPLSLNSSWAKGVYTIKVTRNNQEKIFTLQFVTQ